MTQAQRPPLDELAKQFLTDLKLQIKTHGHQLISYADPMPITYSVGLYPQHGIELIIIGLRVEFAAQVLNSVADALASAETGKSVSFDPVKTPVENQIVVDVPDSRFSNLPVLFKHCNPEKLDERAGLITTVWKLQVPVLQIVMPDADGIFPHQPGFNHLYMDPRQPLLY